MDKIIVIGMATIPGRVEQLERVLKSLHGQCDVIELALNDYPRVPYYIRKFPKVKINRCSNERGDANKFLNVANYTDAYYFSCDDDILYPEDYTRTYISYIKRLGCLATIHGSDMPERKIQSYYKGRIFRSHCLNDGNETYVDIAGSGVSGFDTSILKLKIDDFIYPNMADIFMSMKACEQGVKRLAISHYAGWITGRLNKGPTIYETHKNKDALQTRLVNNFNWKQ